MIAPVSNYAAFRGFAAMRPAGALREGETAELRLEKIQHAVRSSVDQVKAAQQTGRFAMAVIQDILDLSPAARNLAEEAMKLSTPVGPPLSSASSDTEARDPRIDYATQRAILAYKQATL